MSSTTWEVEFTDEFGSWWAELDTAEHEAISATVEQLEEKGPHLPHPYSTGITTSRHAHMRELRVQARGAPIRILYAFDPRRVAILLLGGDKTGDARWYQRNVPIADRLYDHHLSSLRSEGLL